MAATKTLAFRINAETYAKLEKLARKDDRSIAGYARKLLIAALRAA